MAIITKGKTRKEIPDSDIAKWTDFGWTVRGAKPAAKPKMELKAAVSEDPVAETIEKKDE